MTVKLSSTDLWVCSVQTPTSVRCSGSLCAKNTLVSSANKMNSVNIIDALCKSLIYKRIMDLELIPGVLHKIFFVWWAVAVKLHKLVSIWEVAFNPI